MATAMISPNLGNDGQLPEPTSVPVAAQVQPNFMQGGAPVVAQPAQAPAQPSPQDATALHDSMIGKAFKILSGQNTQYTIDPQTGKMTTTEVPNTPGQFFKNVVAAALVGGAASASHARENGGSPLAAVAEGGAANINRNQALDQERIQRAQQDYKNQLTAQNEQREDEKQRLDQQNFQSEEVLRKAQIAHANAETVRTNQLTQGDSFTTHQKVAEAGQQHFSDYKDAGLQPVAKDISESEMADFMKNRPGASALDWEATGTKLTKDANGQPVYEQTYTAYDPKGKIPVSKGTLDQWKKDGMDKYYPDVFNNVKPGRELDVNQYIALKRKDAELFNNNLVREKADQESDVAKARINEANASAARSYAEIGKVKQEIADDALGKKQSEQFGKALQELDGVGGDFSKLKPSSRVLIGESTSKLVPGLTKEIGDAIANGDDERAKDLMGELDNIRHLTTSALTGVPTAQTGNAIPANRLDTGLVDRGFSALSGLSHDKALAAINSATQYSATEKKALTDRLNKAQPSAPEFAPQNYVPAMPIQ